MVLCYLIEHRWIHSEVRFAATMEKTIPPHPPPATAITIYRTLAGCAPVRGTQLPPLSVPFGAHDEEVIDTTG